MDTWLVVAIFVTIPGVVLILAVVWLIYKWRSLGLSPQRRTSVSERDDSPTQRYIVEKGKIVPVCHPSPKVRPSLASLRQTSWFLSTDSSQSTPVLKSSNLDSYETSPTQEAGRQWRQDMDAIRFSRSSKWSTHYLDPASSPVKTPRTPLFPPAAYQKPQRPSFSKYSCSPTITSPRAPPRPLAAPPPRKTRPQIKPIVVPPSERKDSFLDPPSADSERIQFPRPPLLLPLQSRFHRGPPWDSDILSTPTTRPTTRPTARPTTGPTIRSTTGPATAKRSDTWDSLQSAAALHVTRAVPAASMSRLPQSGLRNALGISGVGE